MSKDPPDHSEQPSEVEHLFEDERTQLLAAETAKIRLDDAEARERILRTSSLAEAIDTLTDGTGHATFQFVSGRIVSGKMTGHGKGFLELQTLSDDISALISIQWISTVAIPEIANLLPHSHNRSEYFSSSLLAYIQSRYPRGSRLTIHLGVSPTPLIGRLEEVGEDYLIVARPTMVIIPEQQLAEVRLIQETP